jgi:hypothetical protein
MFNSVINPSEKRRLVNIGKTISNNFFRTEFKLDDFIQKEVENLIQTLKKIEQ